MISSCNTIVDRRDHVQYLTVTKSYSNNCDLSMIQIKLIIFTFSRGLYNGKLAL